MVEIKDGDALDVFIRSLNRIDNRLVDHGARVAYIVWHLMRADGRYNELSMSEIVLITLMHDIGAYKTEEIDKMLEFESTNIWEHSVYGYLFIQKLTPFHQFASAILFHHTNYENLRLMNELYSEIAQILNLSDRTDTYLRTRGREGLVEMLEAGRNTKFSPAVLRLFHAALERENFIEKISNGSFRQELNSYFKQIDFSRNEANDFLKMVMYVIDFRSVYTVTHTITTMGISDELGRLMGVVGENAEKLHIGAQLHDLGKISIPIEILEKPGKLTPHETQIMQTHVNSTEEILGSGIDREILENALRHHEKLDGSGYPRGLIGKDLTLTERIVAVADMISALTGRRSYKEPYPKEKILDILNDLVKNGKICPRVVQTVKENYDSIMDNVRIQCGPAIALYENINSEYERLIQDCGKIVS